MIKRIFIIGTMILLFGVCTTSFFHENAKAAGEINIYSPSSGSIYYAGDSIYIGWTPPDAGNYVKIELHKNWAFSETISSNTSNDGSYSWSIPNTISSSSSYHIQVTSLSDDNVYDYSDYFSIGERSITVTSPSSTSTWYGGTSYSIGWNANNAGSYVDIELYKNGNYDSTISSNSYSYTGTNTYSWRATTSLSAGSAYQIKITSKSYSSIYDYSDYFSIGERSITVTSPNSGDILYRGGEHTITWSSSNAGNYVDIELLKNDYYVSTIETYTSNDGSYDWTISNSQTLGSNYKIRVESRSYNNIYDASDSFTIDERYINVNSPHSGDVWFPNETCTIVWNSKNAGENVNIKLYKNDVLCSTISSETSNDGSFEWNVSDIFSPDSNYRIKIRSKSYPNLYGQSGFFTIGKRSIKITSPADEEVWARGSTYTITWDSENIGNYVDIELYQNGNYHSTIVSNYHSYDSYFTDSSYTWAVPSDLTPGDTYQIKISSIAYSDVEVYSEGYIVIEESLLQKITGPLIIVLVFIILVVLTVVILKMRKRRAIQEGGDPGESQIMFNPSKQTTTADFSQEEYNQIWEKNNF